VVKMRLQGLKANQLLSCGQCMFNKGKIVLLGLLYFCLGRVFCAEDELYKDIITNFYKEPWVSVNDYGSHIQKKLTSVSEETSKIFMEELFSSLMKPEPKILGQLIFDPFIEKELDGFAFKSEVEKYCKRCWLYDYLRNDFYKQFGIVKHYSFSFLHPYDLRYINNTLDSQSTQFYLFKIAKFLDYEFLKNEFEVRGSKEMGFDWEKNLEQYKPFNEWIGVRTYSYADKTIGFTEKGVPVIELAGTVNLEK
jgi:hypothetical protein